jgi:pyruvate formate lyase activating enzyme
VNYDYLYDKPITHLNGNIKVMSIGSWGCNLRCLGCQNVKLSWAESGNTPGYREMSPEDIVDSALENGCRGICYTYNEPAIILETVEKIAARAKKSGMLNVFVTNSTLTEKSAERISKSVDAVAADIKSIDDDFYYNYCGAGGISNVAGKILSCISTFHNSGVHVEIRTNIIPGGNDKKENYHDIASWIRKNIGKDTPWHITRFFPAHKLANVCQTPAESLFEAREAGTDEGLKFVYIYPDKGCDCAKDIYLLGNERAHDDSASHCCCCNKT